MHAHLKQLVGAMVLLVVTMPLSARTVKQTVSLFQPTTIGSEQLKPGDYQLKADEGQNQLTVLQNGKVVVSVQGHWTALPKKATNSQINIKDGSVTGVQFNGSTEVFEIQGQTSAAR